MTFRLSALLFAMGLCAVLRNSIAVGVASDPTTAAPVVAPFELPTKIGGRLGRPMALSVAETKLASAPHVKISRMRYGASDVSLISVSGGIREIHPPTVCLKAEKFEVVKQREHTDGARCVVDLTLRSNKGGVRRFHSFVYTYTDGKNAVCSFWQRIGSSVVARLLGKTKTWSTLQVMDRNGPAAHLLMSQLLNRMEGKEDYAVASSAK